MSYNKTDIMKILIPTDDYLTIAPSFDKAQTFRLLTIINGSVKEDSFIASSGNMRDKYPLVLKEPGDNNLLGGEAQKIIDQGSTDKSDRHIVLASKVSTEAVKGLQKIQYEVFYTRETNIINALTSFIQEMATMESDYCCSP